MEARSWKVKGWYEDLERGQEEEKEEEEVEETQVRKREKGNIRKHVESRRKQGGEEC